MQINLPPSKSSILPHAAVRVSLIKAQIGPWHHCLSTFHGAPKLTGKPPNSRTLPDPRLPFQPHPLPELISPGHRVSATSDKQPCSLTAWNALLPPLCSRLLSSTGTVHVSSISVAVKPSISVALPVPPRLVHPCHHPVTCIMVICFLPTSSKNESLVFYLDTPLPATQAPSTVSGHSIFLVNVGRMKG